MWSCRIFVVPSTKKRVHTGHINTLSVVKPLTSPCLHLVFTLNMQHADTCSKVYVSAIRCTCIQFLSNGTSQTWGHTYKLHKLLSYSSFHDSYFSSRVINMWNRHEKKSVCLFVHLSNAWIVTKWKKRLPTFWYHMKGVIILVFPHEEWLVGATPRTWNLRPNWHCWSKNAPQLIFARSAFQSAYAEEHTLTLSSPKRGSKWKMTVFCQKVHFTWTTSATKFPSVNTVREKIVRHSLAYLYVPKWFVGRSLLRKNLAETDLPSPKCWFPINIRS